MAKPSDEEVVSACVAEARGLDWRLAVQEVPGTERPEYVAYGSRILPGQAAPAQASAEQPLAHGVSAREAAEAGLTRIRELAQDDWSNGG